MLHGPEPVDAGFFLTPDDAAAIIKADPRNREVIFPYMIGRDLFEDYGPTRCIIDFATRDQFAARSYALPWERLQERVMPIVLAKAEAEKKAQGKEVTRYTRIAERWWQFYDYRPGTIAAINSVPRWIALSRTSKRPIFEFISQQIHADSKLMVFASQTTTTPLASYPRTCTGRGRSRVAPRSRATRTTPPPLHCAACAGRSWPSSATPCASSIAPSKNPAPTPSAKPTPASTPPAPCPKPPTR